MYDHAKLSRVRELLAANDWNNSQFWEANQILRTISSHDMEKEVVDLLFKWCSVEEDRIFSGSHEGCDAELNDELHRKWPITPQV
jgi:hypothetical protein